MQVETLKPVLKAPGTKCLKLKCDKLLSSFAFNCNLRHYTKVVERFTANYVFALGIARFLSCAHWAGGL